MALTTLSLFNCVNNVCGRVLDLVFGTINNIKVKKSNFSACPVDNFYPPLDIDLRTNYDDSLLTTNTEFLGMQTMDL